jgi:hypothetical protein
MILNVYVHLADIDRKLMRPLNITVLPRHHIIRG